MSYFASQTLVHCKSEVGGWCQKKNEDTVWFEVHIQPVILTDTCSWLILIHALGLKKKKKLRILAWSSVAFQIHKDCHSPVGEESIRF